MPVESPCVAVPAPEAERARRILAGRGLLARGLKAGRRGDRVLFPVRDSREALEALRAAGVRAEACVGVFEEYRRPGRVGDHVPGVSSYVVVGEAAIINERPGLPREALLEAARRIMELHPRVRGVYLKRGTEGGFRLARLELLLGERVGETIYREYGLEFVVDVEKVYVNPSLAAEHRRVAELASDGELFLDMFSGYGAFAIHAAHLHELTAVSVDLNPHASRLAIANVWRNKSKLRGRVIVVHADAAILPEVLRGSFDRIVMNHPTESTRFIPVACRLLAGKGWVHLYRLSDAPEHAWEEARGAMEESGCEAELLGSRRVIEYSPRLSIYALDIEAGKA